MEIRKYRYIWVCWNWRGKVWRVPDVVEPADIGLICLRVYACDDGTNEIWRESTINIRSNTLGEIVAPFLVERGCYGASSGTLGRNSATLGELDGRVGELARDACGLGRGC